MKKRLRCYLRSYRRRWGFTQQELAFILGIKGNGHISRLERGEASPTLAIVLALYVMFGTAPEELFPALFAEIEDHAVARAYDLYERLQGGSSKATRMKLDFLEAVFERAKQRSKNNAHA